MLPSTLLTGSASAVLWLRGHGRPRDGARGAYQPSPGMSHASHNTAEAEPVSNVEGNMCGPAMRGTDALPWSKNTSRTKGRRRTWEVSRSADGHVVPKAPSGR